MAFKQKEWKARLVEFAGRRILKNVATGESVTYDVSRSEGEISQEGDAFSPANMNDLEQRIADGFEEVDSSLNTLTGEGTVVQLLFDGKNFLATGKVEGADAVTKKLGEPEKYACFFSKDGTAEGTGGSAHEIYCYLSNYTDDYAALTEDQIVCDIFSADIIITSSDNGRPVWTKTWDATTSKLTVSLTIDYILGSSATIPVYIIR